MSDFISLIKSRRSIYHLGKKSDISPQEIVQTICDCLKQTPTAFNSQTGRVIVLFNEPYKQFWISTKNTLKKITPPEQFEKTKEKLTSFSKGIGSILFFEEQHTIQMLQKKFSLYADNFPIWSMQSAGMLQYCVWLALTELGLGANLQHYNPLVDDYVQKTFSPPASWKLLAQMNFGSVEKPADEKTFLEIQKRIKVFE